MRLDDKAYAELLDVRVREPSRIAEALGERRRRAALAPDGVLFIVAADHTRAACSAPAATRWRWSTGAACWSVSPSPSGTPESMACSPAPTSSRT